MDYNAIIGLEAFGKRAWIGSGCGCVEEGCLRVAKGRAHLEIVGCMPGKFCSFHNTPCRQ
jgi:hypothetical protein